MNPSLPAENLNILWANFIIEECIRCGITLFCCSPGSRSTPLAIALARVSEQHPKIQVIVCTDERAAAFYALGYARATRTPAALICTSGTAVANYLPAVVEAAQDAVPMLLLTADRPPELREAGANQTIPQPHIFGEFVRWHFDLPAPSEAISPRVVLTTIDHAVFRAKNSPAGAVHINCQFREPLAPTLQEYSPIVPTALAKWHENSLPFTRYGEHYSIPDEANIRIIAQILDSAKFPLLVVGRLSTREERDAVMQCAYMWRVPIVADIASGLRLHDLPNTITYLDQLLLKPDTLATVKPDAVLHVGGSFVSKRLLQWLGSVEAREYIVLEETPFRHDPLHHVTMRLQCHIPTVMKMLYKAASGLHAESALAVTAFHHSQSIERTLETHLDNALKNNDAITEITAAMLVSRHIPSENGLFLSNSMPVRDMDMFGLTQHESGYIPIGTNRGASGIDGILATASGFALGLTKPVTVMIGDLALLHDLNSTLLAARNPVPVIIIAVNNNGGGIFSFLPIAKTGIAKTSIDQSSNNAAFERFWGTPTNVEFGDIAHFAGLLYETPTTTQEFEKAYEQALKAASGSSPQSTLIEIRTDRTDNVQAHTDLQATILRALEG